MEESLDARIAAYLTRALGVANVRIETSKVVGGASRDTWSVHAEYQAADGTTDARDLVFRMDPETSLLPNNGNVEFTVYQAFGAVPGVPVPEVLFLEDDPAVLGAPFFVMAKAEGSPDSAQLLGPAYDEYRPGIARQKMRILGRIVATDWQRLGLGDVFEVVAPEDVWRVQLDYWERVLRTHDMGPSPVTEAALRYLRRHPPPPAERLSVVHGDFRIGNFLFSEHGVEAILDWEMSHLGDPHEDLAWASAPNWRPEGRAHLLGGMIEDADAFREWEAASGQLVDEEALRWWRLFTHVKGSAIWITGAHTQTFRYIFLNWGLVDREERWMLEDMGVST